MGQKGAQERKGCPIGRSHLDIDMDMGVMSTEYHRA